jgi:hypothetical protein
MAKSNFTSDEFFPLSAATDMLAKAAGVSEAGAIRAAASVIDKTPEVIASGLSYLAYVLSAHDASGDVSEDRKAADAVRALSEMSSLIEVFRGIRDSASSESLSVAVKG